MSREVQAVETSRGHSVLGPAVHTDSTLVERCRRGDELAYEQFYRRYAGRVYSHLCHLLGSGPEAEDALQQTFIVAYRSIRKFRGDSKVSTWLHGIAVRTSLNMLRARHRRQRAMDALAQERSDSIFEGKVEERVLYAEVVGKIDKHLEKLSPKKRITFTLYYFEHLEIADIAERMGCTSGAVWLRLKRARKDVLKSFNKYAQPESPQRGTL